MFCSSRFSKIFNGKEGRKLGKGGAGDFFFHWVSFYVSIHFVLTGSLFIMSRLSRFSFIQLILTLQGHC